MTGLFVDVSGIHKSLMPKRVDYIAFTSAMTKLYGPISRMIAYVKTFNSPPLGFMKVLKHQGYDVVEIPDVEYDLSLQLGLDVLSWANQADASIIVSNDPKFSLLLNWCRINLPKHKLTVIGTELCRDVELLAHECHYINENLLLCNT